jgi:hypothetical protein
MGKIVDPIDPAKANVESGYVDAQIAHSGVSDPLRDVPDGPGFFATAYETWMHETWIGNSIRYGIMPDDKTPWEYDYNDPTFNVFKHYLDNKKEFDDMDLHVKNGLFDDVVTEAQFQDRVGRLRKEMESKQAMADGNGLGLLVGGVLSFADVSTLIPGVNVAKKLQTAGKVGSYLAKGAKTRPGKYALAGAYYSAVQEAGLHTMQDLRTAQESGYNIAGGAVLGGTLGGAMVAASPKSFLHPKNPNYVLRDDSKLMMGIRAAGKSMSESVVIKPVMKAGKRTYEVVAESPFGQRTAGAAEAVVQKTQLLKGELDKGLNVARQGVQLVGKVGQAVVQNTVGQASPLIRGLTSPSQVMMNMVEGLYDMGGILTKGHTQGEFVQSVEDIASRISHKFDTEILITRREKFMALQEKLAQLGQQTGSRVKRGFQDFKQDVAEAVDDFKAGIDASGKPKKPNLEGQDGNLRQWEFDDVVRQAMHEDLTPELVANLEKRFGQKGAKAIIDAARDVGEDIHKLNKEIEDRMVESGLIDESQRMGRDYIAPQMWDGKGVRANEAKAKAFFLEVFGGKPSDEFLDMYRLTPDDFEKLGKEDVVVKRERRDENGKIVIEDDIIAAGADGNNLKLELLEEWQADIKHDKVNALSMALETAEAEAKRAQRQAVLAARDLRKSNTDYKNASVDEARKIFEQRQAQAQATKARAEKLRLEKQELELQIKRAEEEARIAEETPVTPRQLRDGEVREAEDLLDSLKNDPNATKEDFDFAQDNLTRKDIDAENRARQRNVEKNKSEKLKRLRARQGQVTRDLAKIERRLPALEDRLKRLSDLLEEATTLRKQAKDLADAKRMEERKARKEGTKTKNFVKRLSKRLEKLENADYLGEYVRKLYDNLAARDGSGQMPINKGEGIDDGIFVSSRTKRRMIKLNGDQRRRAEEMGILRADMFGALHEGTSELAKRIAFKEKFGQFGSTEDEILKNMKEAVRKDYEPLIEKARKEGKNRKARNLTRRMERDITDLDKGVKRQLGVLMLPDNPEGIVHYMFNKAREWNYVRYGSGFLIPSMTDLSNVALSSGFGTFSHKNLKGLSSTIKGMSNPEIRRLAVALEMLMHNSRTMKMGSTDDMRRMAGIGQYGSTKHFVTSRIDNAFRGMGQATNYASGMLWWNTRLKMLAMIEMQHNFTSIAGKYEKLLAAASAGGKGSKIAEQEIAKLASLGLGEAEMRGVINMMAKHPPQKTDGVLELGMGRWLNEGAEGRQAYDAVMTALEHVANRAIMTPGKGDTPFFMSHWFGKSLMQFQTYGFVIMTRYMMPAFQRMATYGDMEAFLTFAMNVGLGTGVVFAKDILNNGEIRERDAAKWAYDVIDRSGMLTYMSPILGNAMMYAGETPSRYSREQNRLALAAGPTGGLGEDLLRLGDAALTGDTERMGDQAQKLLPLSMYQKIFKVIFGDED